MVAASELYTWILIPLLIFIARVLDVSIGTIRVIFISRGFRLWAPLLGFFEILIWLGAVRQILLNLSNVFCYIAYAGGFAAGTFTGMYLEEKISIGKVVVRIVSGHNSLPLLKKLKTAGYVVTSSKATGPDGKVMSIFTIINRHDARKLINIIKELNPHAFYSIEDVRFAKDKPIQKNKKNYLEFLDFYRKGK